MDNKELYQRCDEILHYIWDPIGVAGIPQARDEYTAYVPDLYRLLVRGAEAADLRDHLLKVETERMALPGDADRAQATAETLLGWRDALSISSV